MAVRSLSQRVAGFLLFLACLGAGTPDPRDVPRFPDQPPPKAASPAAQRPAAARTLSYQLEPGWNVVSFPLARLGWARGFQWQLLGPSGPIDPVAHPEQVDTARGYWAYCDAPAQVEVGGDPNSGTAPAGLRLSPGWNLVGCPFDAPVQLAQATLGDPPVPLTQAASQDLLYPQIFTWEDGRCATLPLAQGRLEPYHGTWVFARQYQELHLNLGPSDPFPTVAALRMDGGELVVTGSGFGSSGTVMAGDVPLSTTSWTDGVIRLKLPENTPANAEFRVVSGGHSSNLAQLAPAAPSAMSGVVLDDANLPVARARVTLDGVSAGVTDATGRFSAPSVNPGMHQLVVDGAQGGKLSQRFDFAANARGANPLMFTMPVQRGTLSIRGYSYGSGSQRYVPYMVLVWERGNYGARHYRKWFTVDWGWGGYDLDWSRLPLGRTYCIQMIWKNKKGNSQTITRYRRLVKSYQTEYIYNSWTYQ